MVMLLECFKCGNLPIMLKIRLQRIGKKGQAYFRLVVLEHTQKPKGRYLEDLGSYDPHLKVFNVKKERIFHWISKGAQFSGTVNNLLINHKVIKGEKVTIWKSRPKKKAGAAPAEVPAPAV